VTINGGERIFRASKTPVPAIVLIALDSEDLPDASQPREHRATSRRQSENLVPIGFRSDHLADALASTGPQCSKSQHGGHYRPALLAETVQNETPLGLVKMGAFNWVEDCAEAPRR